MNCNRSCPCPTPSTVPCIAVPAAAVDPTLAWDTLNPRAAHSTGAIVYDSTVGANILWNTWNPKTGRPYLASEAPYLRAGHNVHPAK